MEAGLFKSLQEPVFSEGSGNTTRPKLKKISGLKAVAPSHSFPILTRVKNPSPALRLIILILNLSSSDASMPPGENSEKIGGCFMK
jgi:hypothetical protein